MPVFIPVRFYSAISRNQIPTFWTVSKSSRTLRNQCGRMRILLDRCQTRNGQTDSNLFGLCIRGNYIAHTAVNSIFTDPKFIPSKTLKIFEIHESDRSDESGITSSCWLKFRRFYGHFYSAIYVGLIFALGCIYYFADYKSRFLLFASSNSMDVDLLSCGSFNPPTIMHLRMFELARDHLRKKTNYRVVEGIISPVHHGYGKKGLIDTDHRIAMLRLATSNSKWIRISDWEARQPTYCRTVVVLRRMREETGKHVMLLCGADLLKSFTVPNVWSPEHMEEILGDFGVVVITRAGTELEHVITNSALLSRFRHNIHVVTERIPNEISSTRIRHALAEGESVRYLVPDGALDYIYDHGLYGTDTEEELRLLEQRV